MNNQLLPIHFAPLQGFTDAAYRTAHSRWFGGVKTYYTPFVRCEQGEIRRKDERDIKSINNQTIDLVPQLIGASHKEILPIIALFIDNSYQKIDINMGCPFPMVVRKKWGSGLLPYTNEAIALITDLTEEFPTISFSVKMRLGWDNTQECMALLLKLNELPLSHITLHPRLGKQQYKGDTDIQMFEEFYNLCKHPLIYNGDLLATKDIQHIKEKFPRLAGVMIGRGLLANPALALEYQQGKPLDTDDFACRLRHMHDELFANYQQQFEGGEGQLLQKMKTFWEYLLPDADKKSHKIIQKTSKLTNYQAAVNTLLASL